jgi:hypothetical protein
VEVADEEAAEEGEVEVVVEEAAEAEVVVEEDHLVANHRHKLPHLLHPLTTMAEDW